MCDRDKIQRAMLPIPDQPHVGLATHDAKFINVKMPEGTKMMLQERTFTSPIWYAAAK